MQSHLPKVLTVRKRRAAAAGPRAGAHDRLTGIIGSIEMSVAPAPINVGCGSQRSCRPDLVASTPSTADNSRVGDASCRRDADAAVLEWRNAITKSEPGPGEIVMNQANSRCVTLPPDISQVFLVLQGGSALGAYQVGVYQAPHEAGIEPDWVIGTLHRSNQRKPDCRQRRSAWPVTPVRILEPGPARTIPSGNRAIAVVWRAGRKLAHGCCGHSRLFQTQSICLRPPTYR